MNRKNTNFFMTALMVIIALTLSSPVDAKKVRGQSNNNVNKSHNSNKNKSSNRNKNSNKNSNVNVNRNSNTNVNVNVDVDNRNRHNNNRHGCCHHDNYNPIATAVAVTATAVVVGSIVNSVPPNCTTVMMNGFAYQQCGNTWYQPQISGSSTTYIIVNQPY